MSRWIVAVAVAVVVAIGAVLAVALGSGGDPEAEPAAAAPGAPDAEAALEFRQCLEANGADLPEPPEGADMPEAGRPPGAMPEIDEGAMEACSDLAPQPPEGFGASGAPPGLAPTPQN